MRKGFVLKNIIILYDNQNPVFAVKSQNENGLQFLITIF